MVGSMSKFGIFLNREPGGEEIILFSVKGKEEKIFWWVSDSRLLDWSLLQSINQKYEPDNGEEEQHR